MFIHCPILAQALQIVRSMTPIPVLVKCVLYLPKFLQRSLFVFLFLIMRDTT